MDGRPKRIKKFAFTSVCVYIRLRVDGALKKVKTYCSCELEKFVSLTVFPSSFLLFITFDIMLERRICWTRIYGVFSFTSNFLANVRKSNLQWIIMRFWENVHLPLP